MRCLMNLAEEARTKTLAELTGDEVVQDCLGEILAIETISVLETAQVCVIMQAVDDQRDGE